MLQIKSNMYSISFLLVDFFISIIFIVAHIFSYLGIAVAHTCGIFIKSTAKMFKPLEEFGWVLRFALCLFFFKIMFFFGFETTFLLLINIYSFFLFRKKKSTII